jgi:hypothetical protein
MAVCLVDAPRPRDGASSENMVFEFCSENFLPPCFRSNRFEGVYATGYLSECLRTLQHSTKFAVILKNT